MSAPMSTTDDNLDELLKKIWMIRKPCDAYKIEYQDCKSRAGRKHQRYTLGYEFDCSKWKEDYDNCNRFEQEENIEAAFKILENETIRREKRLTAAANNDVWEYRDSPPKDWNEPLSGTNSTKNGVFEGYNQTVQRSSDMETTEWSRSCSIL